MRIESVKVENFRTLQSIDVSFESYYCTVSGHNNAGKSALIRLLTNLLGRKPDRPWIDKSSFNYSEDYTHWLKEKNSIRLVYEVSISQMDDPSLVTFIERLSQQEIKSDQFSLYIENIISHKGGSKIAIYMNSRELDVSASKEIVEKIRNSNTLFVHNSPESRADFFFGGGKFLSAYDVILSQDETNTISTAEKSLRNKIKRVARGHKDALNEMLGRLSEKYEVELTAIDAVTENRMPLGINIKDRNVDVPLADWGSGTKNRTHILISILQANRIKQSNVVEDRITPIVIVEEPESFLHPSAQAEFGKVLQDLSEELKIQIIVSTHSPFMLNQISPKSNILFRRKIVRGKPNETEVVDTSGEEWMAPFAEHLGIVPTEFSSWKDLFGVESRRAVLVEGEIDQEYFEMWRERFPKKFPIPEDVEIIPYGGKDALKNTAMLNFVLRRLSRVYITYDLDAEPNAKSCLEKAGLKVDVDFCAVGVATPGKECVEGILPEKVKKAVFTRETDIAFELTSTDPGIRKKAKVNLKRMLLDEFRGHDTFDDGDLKEIAKLGSMISKKFSS